MGTCVSCPSSCCPTQLQFNQGATTLITAQHLTLDPTPALVWPSQTKILDDTMRNTHFDQTSTIKLQPQNKPLFPPPQHFKPISREFYNSLAMEEYKFPPHEGIEFKNVEMKQQVDKYGVKYAGEWFKDTPHGNGVMTSNISHYFGMFKKGMKYFHGREILSNEVYEGQFLNDLREGKGVRYIPNKIEKGLFKGGSFVEGSVCYHKGDALAQGTLKISHGINCNCFEDKQFTKKKVILQNVKNEGGNQLKNNQNPPINIQQTNQTVPSSNNSLLNLINEITIPSIQQNVKVNLEGPQPNTQAAPQIKPNLENNPPQLTIPQKPIKAQIQQLPKLNEEKALPPSQPKVTPANSATLNTPTVSATTKQINPVAQGKSKEIPPTQIKKITNYSFEGSNASFSWEEGLPAGWR